MVYWVDYCQNPNQSDRWNVSLCGSSLILDNGGCCSTRQISLPRQLKVYLLFTVLAQSGLLFRSRWNQDGLRHWNFWNKKNIEKLLLAVSFLYTGDAGIWTIIEFTFKYIFRIRDFIDDLKPLYYIPEVMS